MRLAWDEAWAFVSEWVKESDRLCLQKRMEKAVVGGVFSSSSALESRHLCLRCCRQKTKISAAEVALASSSSSALESRRPYLRCCRQRTKMSAAAAVGASVWGGNEHLGKAAEELGEAQTSA